MADVNLLEQARQKHKAGELETAERTYREILDTEPDHPDALHLLGVVALQCGRSEEAVKLLKQATLAKSDFTQALNNLGSALAATQQQEEAKAAYREALSIDPAFADAHFNLGVSYQATEDFKKAIDTFEKALELNPTLVDAELNRGVSLKNLERPQEAVGAFRRAIELDPNQAIAYLNLGLVLRKMDEGEQAIEAFRRASELSPDRADALTFLGQTLWWQGQKEEALAPLERAAELAPDSPPAQYDLTKALFELGDPRAPDARLNLGVALLKAGELDTALDAFESNLGLEGGLPTTELAMKVMTLKEMGRHPEMETLLGYDQFLRAAIIDRPTEFDSVDAFNDALSTHARAYPEDLTGTGGPITSLEQIVTGGVTAIQSTLPADASHPFSRNLPGETTVTLRRVTLASPTDAVPRYTPDAWLSGVYFVELAGNPAPEEGPEIEFGCPDPHLKEWMKIRGLRTAAGKLLMFPAFWFHRLPAPDMGGETLAIAIEVTPTG